MVREAIRFGIDPITALRMGTLNTAERFGLHARGAIAPGRVADLIVLQNLDDFRVRDVYAAGQLVASEGALCVEMPTREAVRPAAVDSTVKINPARLSFDVAAPNASDSARVRVIGSLPDQLVTESRVLELPVRDGQVSADPTRDVLKMAVVDRHSGEQRTGLGFIQGIRSAARRACGHGRPRSPQLSRHRRGRCVDAGGGGPRNRAGRRPRRGGGRRNPGRAAASRSPG